MIFGNNLSPREMVFFTRISAQDKKKIEQPVDYMDIVRKGALTIAEKSGELWLKFVAFFRYSNAWVFFSFGSSFVVEYCKYFYNV